MSEIKRKKTREELRAERIERHIAALKESGEKVGQLMPVVESQFGVVSGSKRLKANPEWRKKKIQLEDEYQHWKAVAGSNIQIEPSEAEWKEWINKAIAALKRDRKMDNAAIVKQLEKDFGLSKYRIYQLMSDEFKREYTKADLNLMGITKDDESESLQSKQLTQTTQIVDKGFKGVKGIGTGRSVEQLLVEELKKLNVVPEVKVKFNRPYKYPRPYYADLKIGKLTLDMLGKSSEEEREERDKYFITKGMYPIHFPPPMVKKYAPVIASLIHGLIKYGAS